MLGGKGVEVPAPLSQIPSCSLLSEVHLLPEYETLLFSITCGYMTRNKLMANKKRVEILCGNQKGFISKLFIGRHPFGLSSSLRSSGSEDQGTSCFMIHEKAL